MKNLGFLASPETIFQSGMIIYYAQSRSGPPLLFGHARGARPNTKLRLRGVMTLEQACPPEYRGAQCAFKDSMIH